MTFLMLHKLNSLRLVSKYKVSSAWNWSNFHLLQQTTTVTFKIWWWSCLNIYNFISANTNGYFDVVENKHNKTYKYQITAQGL